MCHRRSLPRPVRIPGRGLDRLDFGNSGGDQEPTPTVIRSDAVRCLIEGFRRLPDIRPLAERILPAFEAHLGAIDLQTMEEQAAAVYGILPDERLAYYNPAWVQFAAANDAPDIETTWPLGRSVAEAISEQLRDVYRQRWADVRREGQPWHHRYECSSPGERRYFWMKTMPLADGGLLVVNALHVQHRQVIAVPGEPATKEQAYRNAFGYMRQCSYCRRTLLLGPEPEWQWVPAFLDRAISRVTHGMCEPCFEYYVTAFRTQSGDEPDGDQDRRS